MGRKGNEKGKKWEKKIGRGNHVGVREGGRGGGGRKVDE